MNDHRRLAEAIRIACIEAALRACEEIGIGGLCEEGRWERTVEATRNLALAALIQQATVAPDDKT